MATARLPWRAAGSTGYRNTEIGQIIVLAYLDAHTKLVTQRRIARQRCRDGAAGSLSMANGAGFIGFAPLVDALPPLVEAGCIGGGRP